MNHNNNNNDTSGYHYMLHCLYNNLISSQKSKFKARPPSRAPAPAAECMHADVYVNM